MISIDTILALKAEFNIKHPLIITEKQDLKLFKKIFKENETASMNSWFPNITGSGLVLNSKERFLEMKSDPLRNPWMIISTDHDPIAYYSRVDEPIFTFYNDSVWENYKFKDLIVEKELCILDTNDTFTWLSPVHSGKNDQFLTHYEIQISYLLAQKSHF